MARTVYEAAAAADVGAVILELARSEQTYTFQRPIDYATVGPRRRDRGRLAGSGLHPGRPLPVQRQEVRRRPRGDDRGDPARLPAGDRCRLPQHRHRLARRSSTSRSRTSTRSSARTTVRAAELTALIRTLETDGVTISVGGEIGEVGTQNSTVEELRAYLDGYRRELDARAPGAQGHLQGQRPDRHLARRRPAARTAAWPRSSSTSRSSASSASSPASTGWPVPSSTARRRCPMSCSIASRRSRRPRSTSRPGSRTRSTSTRRSRPRSIARSRPGASRTRPTSASPARPTSSSSTRPARRRSGRSSGSSGTSPRRTRSSPRSVARSRYLFTELGVNDSFDMVKKYVSPVEVHRPVPDGLRETVAAD